MSEDSSKKGNHKSKHGAKDQRRKPRQSRHQASLESKVEKKPEPIKVSVPSKPVYEDPGPEFYKNLKRETDDILKITEEESSKYRKKEIQSNWAKYEIPIECYDEIDEQENLGADYEKLIQGTSSIGGHFQFKHEKSWDITTGPSLYDKYFEIDMENLALALSTIPFYERNNINQTVFSDTDLLTMENRSTRYKQKYYNDKSYTTPELESQDTILNKLKDITTKSNDVSQKEEFSDLIENGIPVSEFKDINLKENVLNTSNIANISIKSKENEKRAPETIEITNESNEFEKQFLETNNFDQVSIKSGNKVNDDIDELLLGAAAPTTFTTVKTDIKNIELNKVVVESVDVIKSKETSPEKEATKPVIESPEDLEKWLDDFLDG